MSPDISSIKIALPQGSGQARDGGSDASPNTTGVPPPSATRLRSHLAGEQLQHLPVCEKTREGGAGRQLQGGDWQQRRHSSTSSLSDSDFEAEM